MTKFANSLFHNAYFQKKNLSVTDTSFYNCSFTDSRIKVGSDVSLVNCRFSDSTIITGSTSKNILIKGCTFVGSNSRSIFAAEFQLGENFKMTDSLLMGE